MRLDVSVDISGAMSRLERMRRDQIPFATARALTDAAEKVKAATPGILERDLDRPTPFTTDPRGVFVARASKSRLEAVVGFRPLQARYLKYQIEGGIRQPQRRALRLPSEQPLNQYGNLPARTIATLIAKANAKTERGRRLTGKQSARLRVSQKVTIFYGDPGDGRPPGIYQRVPLPGSGDNRLVPLIVFPEQSARYEKRVRWYEDAERIARREIGPAFARRMREAMTTAR
ncbi:MAG: hypothetical protein RJA99_4284 [Pseudomonadota bacterium]|jgi:hypothetical protein